MRVKPQTTKAEENFRWAILEVKYSKLYPKVRPSLLTVTTDDSLFKEQPLENGKAVTQADLDMINSEVERFVIELSSERRILVYEVFERIKDILNSINEQTSQYVRYKQAELSKVIIR